MAKILIYTTNYCPYCVRAKDLLKSKNLEFTELNIENDDRLREEMMQKSGRRTVPQIFINDVAIGGCDDLYALNRSGQLDEMLK